MHREPPIAESADLTAVFGTAHRAYAPKFYTMSESFGWNRAEFFSSPRYAYFWYVAARLFVF